MVKVANHYQLEGLTPGFIGVTVTCNPRVPKTYLRTALFHF